MKIGVINDTYKGAATTGGSHFGCELVMETLYDHLQAKGHEVVQKVGSDERGYKLNSKADLFIVNGEGSLHHNRRPDLIEVAAQAPAILINTVWQDNSTEGLEKFHHITVRESCSARAMGGNPQVVPDLLFANRRLWNSRNGMPDEPCQGETDSVFQQGQIGIGAIAPAAEVIKAYQKHSSMVCGRFHGVATCAVLGIPFSAYPSNTHKIDGVMHDMGVFHHFYPDREQALRHCPTKREDSVTDYSLEAIKSVSLLFANLEKWG